MDMLEHVAKTRAAKTYRAESPVFGVVGQGAEPQSGLPGDGGGATEAAGPMAGTFWLSEGFKRIVVNAGLDLQTVKGTGVRSVSKRTFHALRHSFTSALANAGVSPELRMKLTGHKLAEIHRGYTHLELETLKDAIKKLPSMGTQDPS